MSENHPITRRRFLQIAGVTLAGSAFTCFGGVALATLPPPINFIESHPEGDNAMQKILVAYASKAGSTAEVAGAIGEALSAHGVSVEVLQIKHVKDVSAYKGVIIGSAIRVGQWLPEAVNFVKAHQADLRQRPTAYFLVSGFLKDNTPEVTQKVGTYLDPVRAIFEPAGIGMFAGKMDYSKLSFLDRTIAKAVGSVEGDWRNWDAIRAWAVQALPTG
jgi:menaquinone-dependent protoporphyrinogen oxidase